MTPRVDPFAPRVTIERAPKRVHDRDVEIDVSFDDPTGPGAGFMLPVDLGVIASGVPEMRVWFGGGPPDGVQWQAAATHLDLRLPDTDTSLVQIQARDAPIQLGYACLTVPTVFTKEGFRFFFYSNDHEPVHVHVRTCNGEAVFAIAGQCGASGVGRTEAPGTSACAGAG